MDTFVRENRAKEIIRECDGRAIGYKVNLAKKESIESFLSELTSNYKHFIYGIILNAGLKRDGLLSMMSADDWSDVVDVNYKNNFYLLNKLSKFLIANKVGGVIANVTSVGATRCVSGQCNYSSSKAAMIALTKSLAKELGRYGIRVNSVSPGFIKTEMVEEMNQDILSEMLRNVPLGRIGEPNDIANIMSFLFSDKSSYISGADIVVDGGGL